MTYSNGISGYFNEEVSVPFNNSDLMVTYGKFMNTIALIDEPSISQ